MKSMIHKVLFTLSLLSTQLLQADYTYSFETRYAAFFPTSQEFRDTCSFFGSCYEVEASRQLFDCYEGWINFDWFNKKGKENKQKEATRVRIGNISCGLKFSYAFNEVYTIYAGVGPSFARAWTKTRSPLEDKTRSKIAVGAVGKVGLDYYLAKNVYIDVFVDYLYLPVHIKKLDDASGVKVGLALGIKI